MKKAGFTAAAAACLAVSSLLAGNAAAQEAGAQEAPAPQPEAESSLHLELNALQATERGCRFTFVVNNALGVEVTSAAFEIALFDKAGMISRMTIVDFKDLPDGKTKVRQFDFPGVVCDDVGRILINDSTDCTGSGVDPRACIRALKTETRSDVVFGS